MSLTRYRLTVQLQSINTLRQSCLMMELFSFCPQFFDEGRELIVPVDIRPTNIHELPVTGMIYLNSTRESYINGENMKCTSYTISKIWTNYT